MQLRDVLRAARRRWWLVAVALIAALAAAAVVNSASRPRYATSVTFFVTTPSEATSESYQGGLFSEQRVKSYVSLITSERLAAMVAGQPGIDLPAGQIQSRISAHSLPDTVLLRATVTDTDRVRVRHLAAAVAQQFIALVTTVETPAGGEAPRIRVQIISGPAEPTPVSPRSSRNLALAVLLGLLLGVGAAVVADALDTTVKTPEALAEVAGAPVLAVVPYDGSARLTPFPANGSPRHAPDGRGAAARAEALRQLRTNLQFVDVDAPPRVIGITSALPAEGKSTTAVNLAAAFAEAGARVLLVEADLRHPKVATYLGLEGAVGLSNVLAGQVDLDEVVQPWGSSDLHVLASGFIPANPSELLGSQQMVDLLSRVRHRYDMVIVDTPPLLPVTDAAVVAAVVDGVVLVARSGRTHRARVGIAVAALRRVDARLLGCVLNGHPVHGRSDYGGYYAGYGLAPDPLPAPAGPTVPPVRTP